MVINLDSGNESRNTPINTVIALKNLSKHFISIWMSHVPNNFSGILYNSVITALIYLLNTKYPCCEKTDAKLEIHVELYVYFKKQCRLLFTVAKIFF